jgi:hypothetical protein
LVIHGRSECKEDSKETWTVKVFMDLWLSTRVMDLWLSTRVDEVIENWR